MSQKQEFDNYPTFTNTGVLFPQHLDLSIAAINRMNEHEYLRYIESVRLFSLELIEKRCPPFGVPLSIDEIIRNLMTLNNETGVTVIHPDNYSNYTPFSEGRNENISLKPNPNHTKGINHWFFELLLSETAHGINPLVQFYNPETFFKNLDAVIKHNKFKYYERNPNAAVTGAINQLRITNGSAPVYNFHCALAKWIYIDSAKRLAKNDDDYYILDTSMGYGGRLGGALASCNNSLLRNRTVHYYGTDVNSQTHSQFPKVSSFWKEYINPPINFRLHKSLTPAEILLEDSFFDNMRGKFHISLTSCPYFNTEQYSKDPDQSYIKYPNYDSGGEKSWKLGFLKPMIETNYHLLQDGGEFWLNIADINSSENLIKYPCIRLESDAKKFAANIGFSHVKTYNMILPYMNSFSKEANKFSKDKRKAVRYNTIIINGKKMKFEPIFIFKKLRRNK